jgi:2'-5' RNA ligase
MSRGATARLFVAVDPPLEVREELAGWSGAVAATVARAAPRPGRGGLRALDAEMLHLTICFLGSRPVAELEPLAGALQGCAGHACELSLGAPLWLPPRRPHALAVAVHDRDGELARLREELLGALSAASSWQPERRRFRAHITVGRMRAGSVRGGGHAPPLPATPQLSFVPESLALYRSWLLPEGARYEVLAACTLVPAGG